MAYAITATSTPEQDAKSMMEEWDQHMRAFVPDDMMSFSIEGNSEEVDHP